MLWGTSLLARVSTNWFFAEATVQRDFDQRRRSDYLLPLNTKKIEVPIP